MSSYDIVVVGGGTAGCFAASTTAREGLDTVLLERKTREEGGNIACGDAIKGAGNFPDVIDRDYLREESFTNEIKRGIFENEETRLEVNLPKSGAMLDRKRYGEVLLEETERNGVDVRYNSQVKDTIQDNGSVDGVKIAEGKKIESEIVIDCSGSLSIVQEKTDFSKSNFENSVNYKQYCSAYREIVEVEEPVEWGDALVFKPTRELGYLWYFPRSPTVINAGLGFQMCEEPMNMKDVLKEDLDQREEFQGYKHINSLGAALPTRRPYDSAVASGFMAAGDAAGHVNPTTGGGIGGAAKAGYWAGKTAVDAISNGDTSEKALWNYNKKVMSGFGKKHAALDLYNIVGTAHNINEISDVVTALPGEKILDTLGGGTTSMPLTLAIETLIKSFGHWGMLLEFYRVNKRASKLKEQYDNYPDRPEDFTEWKKQRDSIIQEVYNISGAEPKYR